MVTEKSIPADTPRSAPAAITAQPQATPEKLPSTFSSRLRAAKTAEIRRKLDRLKTLLDASALALEQAETRITAPGSAQSGTTEGTSGLPAVVDPGTAAASPMTAAVSPGTAVSPETGTDSTASDTAEVPDQQSDQPRIIMTSPVNRLRLADSLFGALKTESALKAYESLETDSLDQVDQIWIQFQIASCHRRLGAVEKAEKHYRIVASYKTVDVAVEAARWWLDRLHARDELKGKSASLSESLKQLEPLINAE